ncbi:MAG TPA: ParB/RepB/Spo0J family partition protein [Steroidobacteraceae bacterium]|nr:ParB/RepB/Spo0J family partition protein [Steroidobacteraceae bacterium]
MSQKKPSLGRGLADLLGASKARAAVPATPVPVAPQGAGAAADGTATGTSAGAAATESAAQSAPAGTRAAPAGDEMQHLPVDQLVRGKYQPRVDMRQEALEELAISIRNQGVIQPIVVRPLASAGPGSAQYEIIAGERRWRAAQIAGLKRIPAVIRRVPDEAAIAMALIENIQRENLNPLEEARALERLIAEFGVTHEQAAEAVGRSRAAVSNLLRLLELAPEVADMVEKRRLDMGHARALLGIAVRRQQVEAAQKVVEQGLSVRQTEALVRELLTPPTAAPGAPVAASQRNSPTDPDVRALEQDLTERLGAKVLIQQGSGGKGRLVIAYNSLDELDGVLAHIRRQ